MFWPLSGARPGQGPIRRSGEFSNVRSGAFYSAINSEDRRIRTALRMGRLNTVKTLTGYDFSFQPSLDKARILALAELNFVARCEVVHLLGPPGTCKSHLASALGPEAVKAGKSVSFITLADLIGALAKAEREGSLRERICCATRPDRRASLLWLRRGFQDLVSSENEGLSRTKLTAISATQSLLSAHTLCSITGLRRGGHGAGFAAGTTFVAVPSNKGDAAATADRLQPPWPHPVRAWTTVVVLLAASALAFVDRQILSLLVGPIQHDLHISDTQFSLLAGLAFILFYTTMGIPLA